MAVWRLHIECFNVQCVARLTLAVKKVTFLSPLFLHFKYILNTITDYWKEIKKQKHVVT